MARFSALLKRLVLSTPHIESTNFNRKTSPSIEKDPRYLPALCGSKPLVVCGALETVRCSLLCTRRGC